MATAVSTTNLDTGINSLTGGVVIIAIPTPAEDTTYGSSLPCRTCYVAYLSGTQPYINIDVAAAAATGWLLEKTAGKSIEIAVDDLNKIHCFGTAGDKIQILWRN